MCRMAIKVRMGIIMRKDAQMVEGTKIAKAMEDFGGLIREYRLANNLSLQDMTEIVGDYTPSYIWRIENYKRYPKMDTKLKMLLAMWSIEEVHMYLAKIVAEERSSN